MIDRWADNSEDRKFFIRLWGEGISPSVIAKTFRIGEQRVYTLAHRFKLLVKPPAVKRAKNRKCLMCGKEFHSGGSHNHVCKRCKGRDSWQAGGVALG